MKLRLVCILILWGATKAASGTTIDMTPRPVFLLRSGGFVAQDSPTSVSVYDGSGKSIKKLSSSRTTHIAVTSGETHVVLTCGDGTVTVGDLQTDRIVWSKPSALTHLRYIYDTSFSQDGHSCVACDDQGHTVVFDTLSGRQLAIIQFPPMQTSTMSAALSPDGSKGVLIELGKIVYTFDVASGTMKDTGMTGTGPVRYSSDGRFFAFPILNSRIEALRVVNTATMSTSDLGEFGGIGLLRPTGDGKFRLTTEVDVMPGKGVVGVQCDPDSLTVDQVWRSSSRFIENQTDFDPLTMTGVTTEFCLVTRLVDLRDDTIRLTVDNSANFKPTIVSWTPRAMTGKEFLKWLSGKLVFVLAVAAVIVVLRSGPLRSRKARSRP